MARGATGNFLGTKDAVMKVIHKPAFKPHGAMCLEFTLYDNKSQGVKEWKKVQFCLKGPLDTEANGDLQRGQGTGTGNGKMEGRS